MRGLTVSTSTRGVGRKGGVSPVPSQTCPCVCGTVEWLREARPQRNTTDRSRERGEEMMMMGVFEEK